MKRLRRVFFWAHLLTGVAAGTIILIMCVTGGVVMSYPWANALLYRIAGSELPAPAGGRGGEGGGPGAGAAPVDAETLGRIDRAWLQAQATVPEWRSITLRVPARAGAPFAFTIVDGASWNPMARSQPTIDAKTGDVRQWQPYAAQSLGQRARGWMRFGHTGELFGLTGQIVAGVGCAGGLVLVWTGPSLAIRRLAAWRARRVRAPAAGIAAAAPGEL